MSEFNVKFEASKFEAQESSKGTLLVYSDEKVFEDNLTVDKKAAKEYETYRGNYTTQFVKDAARVAEGHFKKHSSENEVTLQAPFGMAKSSHVKVHVVKEKERLIPGFNGQDPKKIKTSQITVKVKDRLGSPSSSVIKEESKDLYERLTK